MSAQDNNRHPEAYVRRKTGISAVWLVPALALVFGGWLLVKAILERGTYITVQFDNARGIVIGKTEVRYKGLTAGVVQDIEVADDLQSVLVEIEMVPNASKMLTNKTLFWYVTADISLQGVSELDTLFSGSYINIQPDLTGEGESKRHFVALKEAPIPDQSTPGLHITLLTDALGSLTKNSPVTFKQITVGHISGFQYSSDSDKVAVSLFIEPEYAELVKENSRFWNASGFAVEGSLTSGVQVRTESLASILSGGVAFDTPSFGPSMPPAQNGQEFILHTDFQTAEMGHEIELVLHWDSGIDDGAAIHYQGLTLGRIASLKKIDPQNRKIIALAKVNPRVSPYLTTETQFYVVSPQVSLGGVTNMHSLMLGAHIGVRPSTEGEASTKFSVFNQKPAYKYTEPGLHLVLNATDFNSLKVGTNVYYKQQQVGSIQAIEQVDADNALIHIHIQQAYQDYVTADSRFWNTSGIRVQGGIQGFELQARSIQSILAGGIEFDRGVQSLPVNNGDQFTLAINKSSAKQSLAFTLSASNRQGISHQTRVMLRGKTIGRVHRINEQQDNASLTVGIFPKYQHILRESTQFWLVKPNLSLAGLSDTDAIFGGSYIHVEVGEGEPKLQFTLANKPQAKHASATGLQLKLSSNNSHGLVPGSRIHYQGITVGQVDSLELNTSNHTVTIGITIDDEYAGLIQDSTRFYNTSGVFVDGSLTNINVQVDSLDSLLKGGLSFYTPSGKNTGLSINQPVEEQSLFRLFDHHQQALDAGVAITIAFNDVSGLQVNQKIKYQDQVIGTIERISFDDNQIGATVLAYINDQSKHLASTGAKFWKASAQLGLTNSTNVKTLLEGDFIQVIPGNGDAQHHFQALDMPPAIRALPYGLNLTLNADSLGSIRVGNPVLYRQVVVGKVIGIDLAPRADQVQIFLNIAAKYQPLVTADSKFWNASGFELDAGLFSGVNIQSESLESLLSGGVSFATPEAESNGSLPAQFDLHAKPQPSWQQWSPKISLSN